MITVQNSRSRHWRAIPWAIALFAGLLFGSSLPAAAVPDPIGIVPNTTYGGAVQIQVKNQTDAPVTYNWSSSGGSHCSTAGNWWAQPEAIGAANSASLPPNTEGYLWMVTQDCPGPNGSKITPNTNDGAFVFGQVAATDFKFATHYSAGGEFSEIKWEGGYTDGGSTGGLYLINCNNTDQVLGDGVGSTSADYSNGSLVCFVSQEAGPYNPSLAGTNEPSDS